MKSTLLMLALVAAIALLLGACATGTQATSEPLNANELAEQEGYLLGDEVQSIQNYDINRWLYVSNRALIIPSRPSTQYLLMLDRNCSALRGAEVIATTSTIDRLRAGFDAIVVYTPSSSVDQRCYVQQIYQLSKKS